MVETVVLRKTALNSVHRAAKAKMVDFGGWDMPVDCCGLVAEHMAVRTGVGVFDVSHMGDIQLRGPGSLEAVQLLRPDEVHLAREAGSIALQPQVMRESRHIRRQQRRVVPGADVGAQLAGHQREARRGTQRKIRVAVLEHAAARRQCVDVRRFHDGMTVGWKCAGTELVAHQQEDIGPAGFELGHGETLCSGRTPCLDEVAIRTSQSYRERSVMAN